ncbi:conjugal transfer protein [Nocardia sp. NPDC050793]|uniref:conjugal transfer protein n=1 Tax=Nocardia sp. NPDC050793 TaxID=3155159 RepID=UPI0033D111E4
MVSIIGHSQLAESFAEEFVVAYLTATAGEQDRVNRYVSADQQVALPRTAKQLSGSSVVHVRLTRTIGDLEIWSVTVAVASKGAIGDRQFYRVAVSVTNGALRALALPAQVPPPRQGFSLALAYSVPCAPDSPLSTVAAGFLQAFLAGSGDINRYLTTDAGITALTPPPYSQLEVLSVKSTDSQCGAGGSRGQVLATVAPKAGGETALTLVYPLTMVRAGGQWQVEAMDTVPVLAEPVALSTDDLGVVAGASTTTTPTSTAVAIPRATQK